MLLTDAMLESKSSAVLLSAVMVMLWGNTAVTRSVDFAGSADSMVAATGAGRDPPPQRDLARRASCRVRTL